MGHSTMINKTCLIVDYEYFSQCIFESSLSSSSPSSHTVYAVVHSYNGWPISYFSLYIYCYDYIYIFTDVNSDVDQSESERIHRQCSVGQVPSCAQFTHSMGRAGYRMGGETWIYI